MKNGKTENIVGALVLALADGIQAGAEAEAPEAGPAAPAITLLGHDPGMPIERLRRALGLSHPGAVRLVDRLVADGLVVRRPGVLDRRAVALHLTEAGEASNRAILDARHDRLAAALGLLDEEERATLGRLTEKLLGGLVETVDQAYSVCRLCDVAACPDCPVEAAIEARG